MRTSLKQIVTVAVIATFAAALTATAEIRTAKGGGQALMQSFQSQDTAPAPRSMTAELTVVMPCPQCRNARTTYASTSRGGRTEYRTVELHVCPGCRTSIVAAGHGKAKAESVIYTCSFADKGAFCCQ